jgi:CRISPR-associated protein Cmr4
VKDGALWYEETLPPESLLYVGLAANKARKQDSKLATADDVLSTVTNLFMDKPWLQIGGNETVGMGWCAVSALKAGA